MPIVPRAGVTSHLVRLRLRYDVANRCYQIWWIRGKKKTYIMEVSDKRLEQDYHPYHIPIYTSRLASSSPAQSLFPRFHIGPDQNLDDSHQSQIFLSETHSIPYSTFGYFLFCLWYRLSTIFNLDTAPRSL